MLPLWWRPLLILLWSELTWWFGSVPLRITWTDHSKSSSHFWLDGRPTDSCLNMAAFSFLLLLLILLRWGPHPWSLPLLILLRAWGPLKQSLLPLQHHIWKQIKDKLFKQSLYKTYNENKYHVCPVVWLGPL